MGTVIQGCEGAVAVGVVYVPWADVAAQVEVMLAVCSPQEAGISPDRRATVVRKET